MKSSPGESELVPVTSTPSTVKQAKKNTMTSYRSNNNSGARKSRSLSPACRSEPILMIVEPAEALELRKEALRINMVRMNSFKLPGEKWGLNNVEKMSDLSRISRPTKTTNSRGRSLNGLSSRTRSQSMGNLSTKQKSRGAPPPPPPPPPPAAPPSDNNKCKRRENSSKEERRRDRDIECVPTKARSKSTPPPSSSTGKKIPKRTTSPKEGEKPHPVSNKHKTRIQQGLVPKPPPPPPAAPSSTGGKSPPNEKVSKDTKKEKKKKIVIKKDQDIFVAPPPPADSPPTTKATRSPRRPLGKCVSVDEGIPMVQRDRSKRRLGRTSSNVSERTRSSRNLDDSGHKQANTKSERASRTTGGNKKDQQDIVAVPPPPPPPPSADGLGGSKHKDSNQKSPGLMSSMRKKLAKGKKSKALKNESIATTDIM